MLSSPTLPMEGGCRCGGVRFRVTAPPMLTMACHCIGCQRMSSSAYSLSAAFPSDGFEVIQGEPVPGGLKGGDIHHNFCPDCLSWMFTRIEGLDWFVNVRATLLDDTSWYEPFLETYTSEMLPWAKTPAVRSYPKFPEMDEYQGLIGEFAAGLGASA
jgi:hypothetical protein